jgi:hypothetical protein
MPADAVHIPDTRQTWTYLGMLPTTIGQDPEARQYPIQGAVIHLSTNPISSEAACHGARKKKENPLVSPLNRQRSLT